MVLRARLREEMMRLTVRMFVGLRDRHRLRSAGGTTRTLGWLVSLLGILALGADWPQWRGPARDGVAPDTTVPYEGLKDLRLRWRVSVGDGYSGPVIVGETVFIHERIDDHEQIRAFSTADGRQRWQYRYPAPYQMHPAAEAHGPGPKATPTVSDRKIYAYGISSVLTCMDATNGKVLWQVDMKQAYEAEPAEYGTAASPLVSGPLVIVPVGGKLGGSVMAFDRQTGAFVWKAVPGERPAMSSPVRWLLPGADLVVTFTERQLVGLDFTTGNLLWAYPFETPYRQNIVTPIVWDNLVVASGVNRFAFALRIRGGQNQPVQMEEVWKNRDLRMYMSSPVRVGPFAYGLGARNVFYCVDLRTGQTRWSGGRFSEYCSVVVAGDKLLILDASGALVVVAADPNGYREISRWQASPADTWAHLAVAQGALYLRDRAGQLYCYELPDGTAARSSASKGN
jgi:outer membrane protein assembly factor BamB